MSDLTPRQLSRQRRNTVSVIAAGGVMGVIVGAALGVFWWALAPRVSIVVTPEGVRTDGFQPQEYLSADISFGALALAAGVFVTVGLIYMRRDHLLSSLVAAQISAVIGTAVMFISGTYLGSVDLENLPNVNDVVVEGPLEITMPAILLMWPLGAAIVVSILALGDFLGDLRNL